MLWTGAEFDSMLDELDHVNEYVMNIFSNGYLSFEGVSGLGGVKWM